MGAFKREGDKPEVRLFSGKDRSLVWANDALPDGRFWPIGADVSEDGHDDVVLEGASRIHLV